LEQRLIPDIGSDLKSIWPHSGNDGRPSGSISAAYRRAKEAARQVVKKRSEEARVAVRNVRRDIIEDLKKSEKEQH